MAAATPIFFDVPSVFNVQGIVGQGAYGVVCKAMLCEKKLVAVKKVPNYTRSPETAKKVLREIQVLASFQFCPQIIARYMQFRPTSGEKDIYFVMEYIPHDLSTVIKKREIPIDERRVCYITCQLLLGLRALHRHNCSHRDLSTRNILINDQSQISICDFGLSRFFNPEEQLSFGVVTQWYRAPEVILDAPYTSKVDIWAVGVILGELFLRRHLFPGRENDSADQLNCIFNLCGTMAAETFGPGGCFEGASENARRYSLAYIERRARQSQLMALMAPTTASAEAKEVLCALLTLDPWKRPDADAALRHRWFEEHREFINNECAEQDKEPLVEWVMPAEFDEVVRAIETAVPVYSPGLVDTVELE